MSFIVEQKIKGKIYLYRVESYWDKEKKQPRQKRTYIGPKKNVKMTLSVQELNKISIKKFGSIFLLKNLTEKIGLKKILSETFPNDYDDILNLCYYQLTEERPEYLFNYWFEENYLPNSSKMNSSDVSKLYSKIGKSEPIVKLFIKRWIDYLNPTDAVYYDITSISSYSKNNNYIEWGYNRDKENLPHLNLGLLYCKKSSLPIYYQKYPGSLTDVKTLKNMVTTLSGFGMENFLFILDRVFFSTSNILDLSENNDNKISFIQPLPFTLSKVRNLAHQYSIKTSDFNHAFLYNNSLLYHNSDIINFKDKKFKVHIFLNEKTKQEQKEFFLKTLLEIEQKFEDKIFKTLKEYKNYKKNDIPEKYQQFFKWTKSEGKIEKNRRKINEYLSKKGIFVIATNTDLNKLQIIDYYRNRDGVEKLFDIIKNELLSKRLRAHSGENAEGRLFVKFITSILYAAVSKVMKEKNLFKTYSFRELMLELNKITSTRIKEDHIIFSELTKRQIKIFDAFEINWDLKHSY